MGILAIRPLEPADRDTIHWIAASTGVYSAAEVEAALAVVDAALGGQRDRYGVHVLEDGGIPAGFVCLGPVPGTEGTWQLHAIGVEHGARGQGLGRHLLAFAEAEARQRDGRLILIESSSHEVADGPTGFYERTGYRLVARVPGFYRPGDDKLIYAKELEPRA